MASREADRPNIVVIVADDQGPWAMGCAGNSEILTPTLDRLAAEGTRFDNFFCASPVCSPARASLLTGRIPSAHGVHDALWAGEAKDPIEFLAGQSSYTDMLAAAGYAGGLSGKWHLGAAVKPQMSFSSWYAWEGWGRGMYWDPGMNRDGESIQVSGYTTDVFTDGALEFLDGAAADDRPFFLNLCYVAPHAPWVGVNPPEWVALYDECPFDSVPQEPPHPWTRPRETDWEPYVEARDNPRPTLQGWFAAVTAMDAAIGRVLARLDHHGLTESTLVLFMSDNGFSCGQNGIWGKGNGTYPQNLYDNSVKVPAIARQPGRVAAGQARSELVSAYDVRPTLLVWAGVEDSDDDSDDRPGRDFGPLLRGESGGHETLVVFDEYGPARMVRTASWKYVHRYPFGPHGLYDLDADPNERDNLVDEPGRASIVAELRLALSDWFRRYADPRFDGAAEAVTGRGQIDLVGPRGGGRPAFNPE